MNHIASNFASPDGVVYRSHLWELRDSGYRRSALVLGFPFWSLGRDRRLITFLLDRGFLVHSIELGFASSDRPRADLGSLRRAAAAYADSLRERGLPLYLVAQSFNAAMVPAFLRRKELAAAALVSPVLDYPPPGTKMPRCIFGAAAETMIPRESLSGKPELLDGIMGPEAYTAKFSKRDLKALHSESPATLAPELGAPVAVFAGEEDPFVSAPIREALASGGAKIYSYPRVRHIPPFDRYADNYYADLGSFFDEIEVASARKKG
ncbi:MAG TPA: alpha/beta fold hydrolase [Rectinemataceae bacterium]|nr:alpha/beta fold hydrolase [Rectinemataceae bacterium]